MRPVDHGRSGPEVRQRHNGVRRRLIQGRMDAPDARLGPLPEYGRVHGIPRGGRLPPWDDDLPRRRPGLRSAAGQRIAGRPRDGGPRCLLPSTVAVSSDDPWNATGVCICSASGRRRVSSAPDADDLPGLQGVKCNGHRRCHPSIEPCPGNGDEARSDFPRSEVMAVCPAWSVKSKWKRKGEGMASITGAISQRRRPIATATFSSVPFAWTPCASRCQVERSSDAPKSLRKLPIGCPAASSTS